MTNKQLTRESINSEHADADWQEHDKKTPARMMPWQGAAVVVDKSGTYALPDDFKGYIAVDEDGDPYAISQDDFDAHYQAGANGKTSKDGKESKESKDSNKTNDASKASKAKSAR